MAMTSMEQVLESLHSKPYEQDPNFGVALNRTDSAEYIKCYVRNWSGNRARRYVTEHISWLQGGRKAKEFAKASGEEFNLDAARAEAYRGQDPSITAVEIKPVKALLQFDNQRFEIDPSKDPKKEPEWVPIPQGVMDLYYGNWERLNSPNARERSLEMDTVKSRRKDCVVRLNSRGENTNEFGFLEFKREIIPRQSIAVDTDQVFSDNYVEV